MYINTATCEFKINIIINPTEQVIILIVLKSSDNSTCRDFAEIDSVWAWLGNHGTWISLSLTCREMVSSLGIL